MAAVGDSANSTLSRHLDSERNHFTRNLRHSNGGEGIAAFIEKNISPTSAETTTEKSTSLEHLRNACRVVSSGYKRR